MGLLVVILLLLVQVLRYMTCQHHGDGQQVELRGVDAMQHGVQLAAGMAGLQEPLKGIAEKTQVPESNEQFRNNGPNRPKARLGVNLVGNDRMRILALPSHDADSRVAALTRLAM
eukprot:CAMPEP_0181456166 /NCGR_PEP_ID=MMETSP1110-20121109/31132_1 /TAXON_ID=174948 /ORGANISM="Symbiodinium sp., Strain CCMP421" /LENGTH=114 /DNA_ID=CAMNT_0023580571 /DNA_START=149 /DNA_END=493 /DNA_ORIENTATION=+